MIPAPWWEILCSSALVGCVLFYLVGATIEDNENSPLSVLLLIASVLVLGFGAITLAYQVLTGGKHESRATCQDREEQPADAPVEPVAGAGGR